MNNKKTGFTLSEVLITLAIIGIVAALTVPSIITKVQDIQYISRFKKIYAEISQATNKMISDNEGTFIHIVANNGLVNPQTDYATLYARYLSAVKVCDTWGTSGQCWYTPDVMHDLAGLEVSGAGFMGLGLILKNGAMIRIHALTDECNSTLQAIEACGLMRIDTNGAKGPNVIGKDIFHVHITKNGILPFGMPPDGGGNGVYIGTYGDDAYSYSNCSATAVPAHGGTVRGLSCPRVYLLQ